VPSDKRARKRAARDAKLAALEKRRRRHASIRRTVTILVLAGVGIGLYALVSSGKSKKTATTTTTTSPTAAAQAVADRAAVVGGCASNPHTTLHKPSWHQAPATAIDPTKTYTATVITDVGSFVIALDTVHAPKTVNNFAFLASQHFYDCVVFHRVIPQFMDQTGDPTGTGSGGPGYSFADELPHTATPQYPIGAVAMANSGPNTNGSQFFVVAGSQGESLSPSYSLFGQVTSGLSVVQQINADGNADPSANGVPPKVLHRILSVTVTPPY
jgi:cyclophilin family peptidyl-prolyl cis-trans isomerase